MVLNTILRSHTESKYYIKNQIINSTMLGRFGTPDDVASLALFLASDEASFITGTELIIDGGMLAQ